MDISIAALNERLMKAEQKAEKARISYENWKAECERITIAISVFSEMSGDVSNVKITPSRSTPSQQIVKDALGLGEKNSRSPMEIFNIVEKTEGFKNDINYVRTTLWRLGRDGLIGNANGRYWHLCDESLANNQEALLHNSDVEKTDMSDMRSRSSVFDDDLLDDDSDLTF